MKKEETVSYEKPQLTAYGFLGIARGDATPGPSGDIPEICDSDFDE